MKTKILYILIFALAFVASSCKRETSNAKPTITVSLEPQKFFLDKIVGDSIEVVCLLQNGANPENYEPSVNDLMAIENSVAYIKMGNVGFEQVLIEKISQNRNVTEFLNTIKNSVSEELQLKILQKKYEDGTLNVEQLSKNQIISLQNLYKQQIDQLSKSNKIRKDKLLQYRKKMQSA